MTNKPTLCLNMIVKDESKIINRLLKSVLPIIDSLCICDTGSTDNTIELIEIFAKENNLAYKVLQEPFQNFEYNRNFSLNGCSGMSDYILFLDADMIFNIGAFNKNKLFDADSFTLLQGSDDFYNKNMRIIKNDGLSKYIGVTHEYISTPPNTKTIHLNKDELFIRDIGDGGSKTNKYERDIKLFTDYLLKDPDCVRSHFYLANSYHDCGQNEKAIETYKKRIKLGGWDQEVWYSYYRIGACYAKLSRMNDAIAYWLEAFDYLPSRVENLYEIINHYRLTSKHKLIKVFYDLANESIKKYPLSDNFLFLHNDVYTYKLEYEYSIIAFYLGVKNINNQVVQVFNNCSHTTILNNTLSNMKYYKDILNYKDRYNYGFEFNQVLFEEPMEFISSSSCILPKDSGYIMNIRCVNYRINNNGAYLNCDNYIASMQKYVELDSNFKVIREKIIELSPETIPRRYVGIEDIRIFNQNDKINFIGVGFHRDESIGIVVGDYDISNTLEYKEVKSSFTSNLCEKNWVYFNHNNNLRVIYKWNPLQVCEINKETNMLDLVKVYDNMPGIFKHVRGSSCGYNYKNEIWFVVHIVSYEEPRHYYHMIVVFNNDSLKLLRYSAPFKFEGEPIEYCISIIVEDERVIIPYSIWDRQTKLSIYDKQYIESILKYC